MSDDYIEELTEKIYDYADSDEECGWLTIGQYRFPKRALIHHVFGRMTPIQDLLPPYEAFSPSGLKLQLDDPFHTDVILGAGWDFDEVYDHGSDKNEALHEAVRMVEDEYKEQFTFDFTILANGMNTRRTYFTARVYEYGPLAKDTWSSNHIDCVDAPKDEYDTLRCIVIPNASIEYDLAAQNADVIITEVGGQLAHLSIVSREKGKLLIRIDGAVERFRPFSRFRIDLQELTLTPTSR